MLSLHFSAISPLRFDTAPRQLAAAFQKRPPPLSFFTFSSVFILSPLRFSDSQRRFRFSFIFRFS